MYVGTKRKIVCARHTHHIYNKPGKEFFRRRKKTQEEKGDKTAAMFSYLRIFSTNHLVGGKDKKKSILMITNYGINFFYCRYTLSLFIFFLFFLSLYEDALLSHLISWYIMDIYVYRYITTFTTEIPEKNGKKWRKWRCGIGTRLRHTLRFRFFPWVVCCHVFICMSSLCDPTIYFVI